MRIIKFILIALSLGSCITQQKCAERFPPQIFTRDSIVIKDTVLVIHDTIRLSAQSVTIHDSIPCPQLNYHESTTSKGLTETVVIRNGVLTATCHEDSLIKIIKTLKEFKTKSDFSTKTTIQKTYVEHWYNPWSLYISIAAIVGFAVWIYLKFKP